MARTTGDAIFPANFELRKAEPIDSRLVVGTKADLVNLTTWDTGDGNAYTYNGMVVSVINDGTNNGLYILKGTDYSNPSNWEEVGSGGTSGTAERTELAVSQTAHGFDNDFIYYNGTTWAKAQADSEDKAATHLAVSAGTDSFTAVQIGEVDVTGLVDDEGAALVAGEYYFLSQTAAGSIVRDQPTSGVIQPVAKISSSNSMSVEIGESVVLDGSGLPHNNTSGLQGGIPGEYYHLSSAQHSALTSIDTANIAYTDENAVFTEGVRLGSDYYSGASLSSGYEQLIIGQGGSLQANKVGTDINMVSGLYYDGTDWRYTNENTPGCFWLATGAEVKKFAGTSTSHSAGAVASMDEQFVIESNGDTITYGEVTARSSTGKVILSSTGWRDLGRASIQLFTSSDNSSEIDMQHNESGTSYGWQISSRGTANGRALIFYSSVNYTYSSAMYCTPAGNLFVGGNCSAQSFTDRTPYPKDLKTAVDAVNSMERLPDGEYQEGSKEKQLDHSTLHPYIQGEGEEPNRDMSSTISCQNEVIKHLLNEVERLSEQIELIQSQINP